MKAAGKPTVMEQPWLLLCSCSWSPVVQGAASPLYGDLPVSYTGYSGSQPGKKGCREHRGTSASRSLIRKQIPRVYRPVFMRLSLPCHLKPPYVIHQHNIRGRMWLSLCNWLAPRIYFLPVYLSSSQPPLATQSSHHLTSLRKKTAAALSRPREDHHQWGALTHWTWKKADLSCLNMNDTVSTQRYNHKKAQASTVRIWNTHCYR